MKKIIALLIAALMVFGLTACGGGAESTEESSAEPAAESSAEETAYLEEPYVPHPLAGVMAQNKPAAAKEKHV